MRRILSAGAMLVLLAVGVQFALADKAFNRVHDNQPVYGGVEDASLNQLANEIFEQVTNGLPPGDSGSGPGVTNCVDINLELSDSVFEGWTPPNLAGGHFDLTNCGDQTARIWVWFSVRVFFNNVVDTSFNCTAHPVIVGPGETVSHSFMFPVPPFDATFTLCAYALSGTASDSDCATMQVTGNNPPGCPFTGCGVLVQGPNCVLFIPLHNSGDFSPPGFVLDNYGNFAVGDSVSVHGLLIPNCATECELAAGCITENTIEACELPPPPPPPPPHFFQACGVLVQGPDCILFAPAGNPNFLLQLDQLGSFGVGDTLFVAGTLDLNCATTCLNADGCVEVDSLTGCNNVPPPNNFQACGVLIQGTGCVLFSIPDSLPFLFELENYGPFVVGDTVFVSGHLDLHCTPACPEATACLLNNLIDTCAVAPPPPPPPPPPPVQMCGTLVQGTDCVLFVPLNADSLHFALDHYGPFGVGDTVLVVGQILWTFTPSCPGADADIAVISITPCGPPPPPPPPPPAPIQVCGELVQGTGCVLLVPLNADSLQFEVESYAPYGVGDTVQVTGNIAWVFSAVCPEADAYLTVDSIKPCGPPPPPPPPPPGDSIAACGVLVQHFECVLFAAHFQNGTQFFDLDNYGDFQPGDSVCVIGTLVPADVCTTACMGVAGCIINNTITGPNFGPLPKRTWNYPNPFNPSTTIFFELSQSSPVSITIYNVLGQRTKTLLDATLLPGEHRIGWDGTDDNGKAVSAGIYFYRITTETFTLSRKMALTR